MVCARYNNNANIANLLINAGANIYAKDNLGNNIIHHLIDHPYRKDNTFENLLCYIINRDISINEQNNMGATPLFQAARYSESLSFKRLLNHGANPFIKTINNPDQLFSNISAAEIIQKYLLLVPVMHNWLKSHNNNYEMFKTLKEITHDKYLQQHNYKHIKKIPRLPESVLKEIFKHLNYPWRYEDQIISDNFDIKQYT